jgi:heme exporter protein CcmD
MEAFAMGNYGIYVWSCFGLALVVVLFADWRARLRHKRVYRDIEVRIKALEDRQ